MLTELAPSLWSLAAKMGAVAALCVVFSYGLTQLMQFARSPRSRHPGFGSKLVPGILIAVIVMLAEHTVMRHEYRGIAAKPREISIRRRGLTLTIDPTTFNVETRKIFTLKAVDDFDPSCYRPLGKIEELAYEQEFTRAELLRGVRSELNPKKTGTFQLRFYCGNGREIGSVPFVVVVPHPAPARTSFTWALEAGAPVYQTSSFEVPIFIRALEVRGSSKIPRSVPRDTQFSVLDNKGNLQEPAQLVISKNSALSPPAYIPFPILADYSLVASEKASGKESNILDLQWATRGPKLDLAVYPQKLEVYAAPISTRSATVYIESDGQRVLPAKSLDILVQAPLRVSSDPRDKLALSPESPYAPYYVTGGGGAGTVEARFLEPSLKLASVLSIHVVSINWFLLSAALAGLIGVICGRQMLLFSETGGRLALSLFTAAVAGCLLYAALVLQWIPWHVSESFLDIVPAGFTGILGGYLGLGVFKTLASINFGKIKLIKSP